MVAVPQLELFQLVVAHVQLLEMTVLGQHHRGQLVVFEVSLSEGGVALDVDLLYLVFAYVHF